MAPTLAQAVAACCVLGGSALLVDHRKPTSGCSPDDWSKLTQHFAAQRQQFSAIQPHLESAYQAADVPKAFSLLSKITPKYCGQADILQTDSFPPQVKFSALQKCIRKSQGVSVACAACFPTYLESMMGKNGVMASHSCMAKCSKVTPSTAQCLARFQDPHALRACLKPEVQKNSIPCLECSKPRLVAYTNCLNMKFLNAETHLNSVISSIRGGGAVAVLDQQSAGSNESQGERAAEPDAGAVAINGTAQEEHKEHGDLGNEGKRKSHKKILRKAKKHHATA